ncbi:hypothetical protein SR70_04875 [Klebsiella aerogenes]|uniref:hypothetical protein n=1 Tax=Klebsiella aerogenes TaxID=548 RepID=UPI0005EDFCB7|nr:hypothetical protein [Klebsiella aerogenes]KJP43604.1 hypothetical protein SR70_04875 [Klebsiella aerogenes]
MKYKNLFTRLYYLDDTSPTGIRKSWNNEPAGIKQRTPHDGGYIWVIKDYFILDDGTRFQVTYDLARVLWELKTGYEPTRKEMIFYADGNKDNLSLYNLTCNDMNHYTRKRYKLAAYEAFRNVILPKANPDYYKDPKDWTDPRALEALEAERRKRAVGDSKPPFPRLGRPNKWK